MSKKSTPLRTCAGNPKAPECAYCGEISVLHPSSARFYGGRNFGPVYACVPCQAWVGCHPGTLMPLGWPANSELRAARQVAHAAFDPIWRAHQRRTGDKYSRKRGYKWLAEQLEIERSQCHISYFDLETCERVVAICMPYRENLRRSA